MQPPIHIVTLAAHVLLDSDDRAVVQLGGDFQIVECTFEQVAEWPGPAGDGLDDDLVG